MTAESNTSHPEWHPKGADKSVYAGAIVSGAEPKARQSSRRNRRRALSNGAIVSGIERGDRSILAQAITLIESEARAHKDSAREILRRCLPLSGKSIRLGITGVPGAGKSTFIECIGQRLIEMGHRVAVLAVDPSSTVSGGSILGDKTRMEILCRDTRAFIRPSPTCGTLGGVAAKTRETITLCEAAGYDALLIETVGVGQSEVAVRSMVDFFLLLQIAGAGDELQGIKKGVVEMADAIVVNKADGSNLTKAKLARSEYERTLHYLHPYTPEWTPRALTCSAIEGVGVGEVWRMVEEFVEQLKEKELFEERRAEQNSHWFRSMLEERILGDFYRTDRVKAELPKLEAAVSSGKISAMEGVERMLAGD